MKNFVAEYKDDTDKLILLIMIISSYFLFCLPAFIVIVGLKKYISESTYNITKAIFNFELLLLLICLTCLIPLIGWILGIFITPIIFILNIIIITLNIIAIAKKSNLQIPVWFEFL
ncbi:MAG: hypothetical protein VZR09_08680 [Candidatus Gastranaerophilaceae bacterium]|nr:hypothetical protein [Candidatus Gastranaerophilaceae bacterium]